MKGCNNSMIIKGRYLMLGQRTPYTEEIDNTELKRQKAVEEKQKDFIAKKSYHRNKTKRRSK